MSHHANNFTVDVWKERSAFCLLGCQIASETRLRE